MNNYEEIKAAFAINKITKGQAIWHLIGLGWLQENAEDVVAEWEMEKINA